jgi:hypothetical protein
MAIQAMRVALFVLLAALSSVAMAQGSRSSVASSTFTGDEDPLSEGGNWEQLNTLNATLHKAGGSALTDNGLHATGRWSGTGTFNESQYSAVVLTSASGLNDNSAVGAICNASADTGANRDYFAYYVDENNFGGSSGASRTTLLVRMVNGTETTVDSDSVTWSAGDEIACEYDSDTDTLYGLKNGAVTSSGSAATIGTGKPGILSANYFELTSWDGGNVSFGGGSSAVPRVQHHRRQMSH